MELISLKLSGENFSELEENFSEFKEIMGLPRRKLRRIYAISAYYDLASIDELIKYMKQEASAKQVADLEFVIVLDRGVRDEEKKCLQKRDKYIRKNFPDSKSGIYLASLGKLFHSKGYLIESEQDGRCAVGSLNLTQSGLTKNEELLVFSEYRIHSQTNDLRFARDFKKYVQEIISRHNTYRVSESNNKSPQIGSSIRDFFLAGRLYYQANETSPFGFPLHLPQEFLKDSQVDISAYLEANASDILNVQKLLDEEEQRKKEKSLWKGYCLQTCYGYWAPGKDLGFPDFLRELNTQVNKNHKNFEYYKGVFHQLEKNQEEVFKKLQKECCRLAEKVVEYMQSNPRKGEDQWKFLSEDGQSLNKKRLSEEWSKWFIKLMKKKGDDFIHRLCHNVKSVQMPDIWKDQATQAAKDFEESFKNSFKYESEKSQSRNQLLKLLKEHGTSDGSLEVFKKWLDEDDS